MSQRLHKPHLIKVWVAHRFSDFYLEISAKKSAYEMELDYGVIHRKFMLFRKDIADYCSIQAKKVNGELELDESYFGGKRKGNRGRGANSKTIVFGILERKGKIYTKIVENVSAATLMSEIENKTKKGICVLHRWMEKL